MSSLLSGITIFVIVILVLLILFFGGALLLSGKVKPGKKGSNDEQKQKGSNPFLQSLVWFTRLPWLKIILVALVLWGVWSISNRVVDIFDREPAAVRAPLVPTEYVLEPGESSPVFRLNRARFDYQPGWNAYIDPYCQIEPYLFLVNERTEGGVTYFDGYQVINSSDQRIMFRTWQSPRQEGESTTTCD